MNSSEDPVHAHLSRVATLLAENVNNSSELKRLRTDISAEIAAAISNYSTAQVKHGYLESMLEAAANVWNVSLALGDADPATDATLKQASFDLQWAALESPNKLPLTHQLRLAEHAFKVATIWGELDQWEAVDSALARGLALSSALSAASVAAAPDNSNAGEVATPPHSTQERCALVVFNSLLLRLRASVRLGQEIPANALLLKLKQSTNSASIPLRQRTMFSLDLLAALVFEGEHLLEFQANSNLTAHIMQAAYDAYTSLSTATPELQAVGLADDAQNLGARALILLCWSQITSNEFNLTQLADSINNGTGGTSLSTDSILKCVHALQKHSTHTADSVAVHFLAHQALQQAGRMQEAETELLKLVTHEYVTPETCAFAIKSALMAPGGAESARAALAAAQDLTSTDDVSLFIELIEAVLGATSQPGSSNSNRTTASAAAPSAADEVILELLEDEALKESLEKDPSSLENMHTLCWNKACFLLEAEEPQWASKFYKTSLIFLDTVNNKDLLYQTLMAICVCENTQGKYVEALEHLRLCNDSCIEVFFLRYQTCLAAKDSDAAAAALKALAAHPDCDPDMLRVLCCEALDAGLPGAAKDVLSLLLQQVQCTREEEVGGGNDGSSAMCLDGNNKKKPTIDIKHEIVIFHNLIQLELDALNAAMDNYKAAAATAAQCANGEQAVIEIEEKETAVASISANSNSVAIRTAYTNLANVFEFLVKRIDAVGVDKLFSSEDGTWHQLKWMLITAWNLGCDLERAAELEIQMSVPRIMACCGHLCAAHPAPDEEIRYKQRVSFTMAAAHFFGPADDASQDARVAEYLQKARSVGNLGNGEHSEKNEKSLGFLSHVEFRLATKQGDTEAAIAALENAKQLFAADTKRKTALFLQMACSLEGLDVAHPCAPARKAAMKAALECLTSQPELNYEAVAGVIRSLLDICTTDTDRLPILRDAAALISAATAGTAGYPPLEARYLITAAWNRGATHSKFSRRKDAEAFMGVALRILGAFSNNEPASDKASGGIDFSADEKKMMYEEYDRVQAAIGSDGNKTNDNHGGNGGGESMNLD